MCARQHVIYCLDHGKKIILGQANPKDEHEKSYSSEKDTNDCIYLLLHCDNLFHPIGYQ